MLSVCLMSQMTQSAKLANLQGPADALKDLIQQGCRAGHVWRAASGRHGLLHSSRAVSSIVAKQRHQ